MYASHPLFSLFVAVLAAYFSGRFVYTRLDVFRVVDWAETSLLRRVAATATVSLAGTVFVLTSVNLILMALKGLHDVA